ncbi:hypothetical protein BBP40_000524 [Aspergillus hancockii]|nr:hypothetical protein BBP40_000524 [Aspergillus hancockii]
MRASKGSVTAGQKRKKKDAAAFSTSTCKYHLQTLILFPDYVNPDTLESFPTAGPAPLPLELACGSSYCSHGDSIDGWIPEAAENMMKDASSNDREYSGSPTQTERVTRVPYAMPNMRRTATRPMAPAITGRV